jgi:Aldehyde dehydrogenase family
MLDHAFERQFAPHAAHLDAAIFDVRLGDRELVDLDETGLDPVNEFERAAQILRPDHRRQPEIAVVGFRQRQLEIGPARNGCDGPENFVAADGGLGGKALDQRGGVKVSVLEPGNRRTLAAGIGEETGRLLVEHPLVRKITFTGSTGVGAEILRTAAAKIAPVTAELGGKNPNIVMPDADIGRAADGILRGLRLQRQGQSCSAGTRIYIHDDIYERVIRRVIDAIPSFKVGDPLDATQVGAIISREQLTRVERYVDIARSTPGAKILCGVRQLATPGGKTS